MAAPKKVKSVPVSMSRRSEYGPRFQEVLKDGKYVLEPHPNQTPVQDIDFTIFSEELSRLGHSQDDIRDKFLFLFRDIESFGDRAATAELELGSKLKRASQKLKKANEKLADLEEKIDEIEAAIPDDVPESKPLNRQQRRAAKKLSMSKATSSTGKLPTKKTVRPVIVQSSDGLTTDPVKAAIIATEIASKIGSVLEPSLKAISDTMQQSVNVAFEIQKNAHGIQASIEKIANTQDKLLNSNQRVFEAIKEIKLVPPEPTQLPPPVVTQITESTKKGIDKSVWDEIIKNRTKPTVPGQPSAMFQRLNGSQIYTDYSKMGPRSPLMGASLAASRHNPMPILAPKPLPLSAESGGGLLSGLAGDLIGGMAGRYALAGAGVVGAGVIGTIAGSIIVPMLLEAAIGMLKDDAKTVTVAPSDGTKEQVRSQKSLAREKFFDSVMEADDADMVEMGLFGPAPKAVPRKPNFNAEGGGDVGGSGSAGDAGNTIESLIAEKSKQIEQLKLSGSNDLGTTRDILNTQAELDDLKSSLNKPVTEQNEILKSALIGPAQDKPYLEKMLDLFESLVFGAVSGGSMRPTGSTGSTSSVGSDAAPVVKSYAAPSGLGSLSAQYESGTLGSAAIGNDSTGGYSYGKYQFSTKRGSFDNLMKGLQEKAPEAYAKLQAAGGTAAAAQGTPEFKAAWKEASSMPGFADAEHTVAKSTLYDPALSRIEKSTGIDVSKRSKALQNVAWSVAIQHGDSGANSVFKSAQQKLGKDFANATDEEIMNSVYDVRGNFFSNSTDAERRSVQARFVKEREAAIGSLQAERATSSVPDVPLSSSFGWTVPTVPEKSVADVAAEQRVSAQQTSPSPPITVVNNSTVAGGQSASPVNLTARNTDNTVERLQNIYLYHGVVY